RRAASRRSGPWSRARRAAAQHHRDPRCRREPPADGAEVGGLRPARVSHLKGARLYGRAQGEKLPIIVLERDAQETGMIRIKQETPSDSGPLPRVSAEQDGILVTHKLRVEVPYTVY